MTHFVIREREREGEILTTLSRLGDADSSESALGLVELSRLTRAVLLREADVDAHVVNALLEGVGRVDDSEA